MLSHALAKIEASPALKAEADALASKVASFSRGGYPWPLRPA